MDKYLVIGDPIEHSLSPFIHTQFAKDTEQSIQYARQKIQAVDFKSALDDLINTGIKGVNVTLPLKSLAFTYADVLSERAKLAGAVNTLKIENNQVFGDNTDGFGLIRDLTVNLKIQLKDARILLLGAGGAARGIIKPLLDEEPKILIVANRTMSKAQGLVEEFKVYGNISASGFSDLIGTFDLILNATSASIGDQMLPISGEVVGANTVVYDLMYAKQATTFMRWATRHQAKTVCDGLGMLLEQAAESFFIWRSVRPSTESLLRELR